MNDSSLALETRELTKVYAPPSGIRRMLARAPIREPILAVDQVSLAVKRGEILGLLGPNGAGKTTLVKMLTTLLRPSGGGAWVEGCHVVSEEDAVKRVIGLVAGDERSFYWRMSGRENLSFFAALSNVPRSEIPERIRTVLAQMRLDKAADDTVYSYSSGMKQKLAFARALIMQPKVLFLDEPTRSLDPVSSREIRSIVGEFRRDGKRTVILTTHRLEEAESLCDRVGIIDKGRILFCGSVAALRARLGSLERYVIETAYLSEDMFAPIKTNSYLTNCKTKCLPKNGHVRFSFSFTKGTNGSAPLSDVLNDVLRSGGVIVSCDRKERRLEELFLDLVGERNGN